jgi:hypothetical protein
MMKQFWLLFFLLALNYSVSAQVKVNEQCKLAYEDILALRFDAAEAKLSAEKRANPENLFVPYLENYIDFLTIFIGEDELLFHELEDNKSTRINRIKELSDTSAYKKYMLGNIHLQWAVARLKFKEYFTAAIEINKAYRLLEKNSEEFPNFVPNNISLGVLHIMIGMIPEKYHWILNLVSMEGSVVEGREELTMVLEQSNQNETYNYLKAETLFYLGFVDVNLNTNPEQLGFILAELEQNKHNNLLLSYLSVNILMRTGQNDKALSALNETAAMEGYFPFFYLDYLSGECHLRKLENSLAIENYQYFLKNFSGRNYIKDAWRKSAWAYLIDADTTNYFLCMNEVISLGYTDVDVDKEALKEAESGKVPNTGLLRARLLFDGGYYHKTDSILTEMDTAVLAFEESVERTYRLGRSAQKQGNTEKSIDFYKITIENGSELDRYFAGNSALKLGEIYESEGDHKMAEFYFQLCTNLDFDEYENSIHSKAKAGLERLNQD